MRRRQRDRDHVAVPRRTEDGKCFGQRIAPRRIHALDAGAEFAQRRAQTAQAHAQLVHMFRVRGLPVGHHGHVRQHLPEAGPHHRRQALALRHPRPDFRRLGPCSRHGRRDGQRVAALGLAAHVQPQAMPLHPARRDQQQRLGRAAQQFQFELRDRHRARPVGASRDDPAFVERQLDGRGHACMPDLHHAPGAADVGGEALDQLAFVGPEGSPQRGAGRRAVVARQVDRDRSGCSGDVEHHLVLEALHQPVALALECLHPTAAALSTQTQRQPGRRQAAVRRVEVARLQAHRARRPRASDCAPQRVAPGRVDAEFELGLDHCGAGLTSEGLRR